MLGTKKLHQHIIPKNKQKFSVILMIVILVCSIIVSQQHSFTHQKTVFETLEDNPLFVPNGNRIQKLSFGFDNLVTDIVWLKTVQYIGGNAHSINYPLLYEYLDNLTDLDPKFYIPYFIGQIILPEIDQADKAVTISHKGLENLPDKWEIPYYLGYVYYYYLEDYEQGSAMYKKASILPGALTSAKRMAINLQSKANKHAVALEMWIEAYEIEKSLEMQDLIAKKILREQNFLELEKAVQNYYQKNRTYPQNLKVLVELGFIEEIPIDPLAEWQKYTINDGVIILQ